MTCGAGPLEARRRAGVLEVVALGWLVVLVVLPLFGYVVGAALVVLARAWSAREKLVGLAIGLPGAVLLLVGAAGYGLLGDTELFFVGLTLSRIPSPGYLGWRLVRD